MFFSTRILIIWMLITFFTLHSNADHSPYFKIKVIDQLTQRGIPMVVLKTTNETEYITDSNGLIAFYEPGLMDAEVFFSIFSHGYAAKKDDFGYEGVRLETNTGGSAVVKLERKNTAQRLYRITGQGIYRDSILLGESVAAAHPLLNAKVMGQDSTLATIYNNKIYWFWGDTNRPQYPLGNFKTTGAVSDLPNQGGLPPETGINLTYFTAENGFVKPMFSWDKPGLVWIDGVLTVNDHQGTENLITHYSHLKDMGNLLEHGLAVFDDEKEEFTKIKEFDLKQTWQTPRYHPIRVKVDGIEYFYFSDWFSLVRVKADYDSLQDQSQYEALTCIQEGHSFEGAATKIEWNDGKPVYTWKKNAEPITSKYEQELVAAGIIHPSDTHFLPRDIETQQSIVIHRGSIRWNAYRKKWILIGGQLGGTSMLGEIWYAEAEHPHGPWNWAQKIVTHKEYSFYNPVHHTFFDQNGGRTIYFEGTYTKMFSGADHATPRYDYNQILYQLNIDDLALDQLNP